MDIANNLTFFAIVVSFSGILGSIVWKVSKSSDEKITQIYKNIRENKKEEDENFLRKDIFNVYQESMRDRIEAIEKRIEKGFLDVNRKLDKLLS